MLFGPIRHPDGQGAHVAVVGAAAAAEYAEAKVFL